MKRYVLILTLWLVAVPVGAAEMDTVAPTTQPGDAVVAVVTDGPPAAEGHIVAVEPTAPDAAAPASATPAVSAGDASSSTPTVAAVHGAEPVTTTPATPAVAEPAVVPAAEPPGEPAPEAPPAAPVTQPLAETTRDDGLAAEPDRITDAMIYADYTHFDRIQNRLHALNENGVSALNYHFCKAQAWLDIARENYADNDRTGVIEQALEQALLLIGQMEYRVVPSMDTPLLPNSVRLRNDLWQRTVQIKSQAQFDCVQCLLAQLEVKLVSAGHEYWELGWRHAIEEVRAAERMARKLESEAAACDVRLFPVKHPGLLFKERITDKFVVYFDFDADNPQSETWREMERLVQFISGMDAIELVQVSGHTDRLGTLEYNRALAQRRVDAVRALMVKHGIRDEMIETEAVGAERPVKLCADESFPLHAALTDCLGPNRRVEIVVTTVRTYDSQSW